ncbi:hypothetical protein AGLY_017552 [Aphis glycines]|uniref:Uncharacterized protein n=1 Tax=Aphis glycines TaxID=307491 RepID=A0A6G0SUU0_APHGL|nr:hypothetical protein AGLY_017552 [Aphis glycines]
MPDDRTYGSGISGDVDAAAAATSGHKTPAVADHHRETVAEVVDIDGGGGGVVAHATPVVSSDRDERSVFSGAFNSNFAELIGSLRGHSGLTKSTAVKDLDTVLKTSNVGVGAFDDAMRGVKATKSEHGYLKVNGLPVNEFNGLLRSGDLAGVLSAIGHTAVNLTESDRKVFNAMARNFPEKTLRQVDDASRAMRSDRPHLDITINNYDKMSEIAKRDVTSFGDNLCKYFKRGTYLALTVGGVTVGADWLVRGLADRRGCWMVRTINNKTTSCRVSAYTCGGGGGGGNEHTNAAAATCSDDMSLYYNATLTFVHVCQLPDTDPEKIKLAKLLDVSADTLFQTKAKLLESKFNTIHTFAASYADRSAIGVCKAYADIEGGIVPYCRMCDPTADPRSTRYVEASLFGSNLTFKCVDNPTVLDVMSDLVHSTGKNLWNGIVSIPSTVGRTVRNMGLFVLITMVLSIIYVLLRNCLFRSRGGGPFDRPPPPPPPDSRLTHAVHDVTVANRSKDAYY